MRPEDQVRLMEQKIKAALRSVPRIVGNEVINFSKDNFRRQGFLGATFQPWKKRKAVTRWGVTPRNKGRAILVDKARLKRGTRITRANWKEVVAANDVPYARAHNEGITGLGVIQSVKPYTRKRKGKTQSVSQHQRRMVQRMPRRQFIGSSPYLAQQIKRSISYHLNKSLR